MKRLVIWTLCCGLVMPAVSAAQGQHDHGAAPDRIGSASVDFQTSCTPAVKDDFNRGVALLHSFWFPEARAAFEGVLAKDAACAMAYWGIALTYWGNPFGGLRSPQAMQPGRMAIDKGQATGSPTPRERGYLDAVAGLFSNSDPGTQRDRVVGYERAMGRVSVASKDDVEARIFWALAVAQAASPTDKTYSRQLQAAEMLEPLFVKMPTHPGLAHYIIHAYDVPVLAPKGLDAARRYASLAPAVPHALHMPSHTFTRVGYWKESIDANLASADSARASKSSGDELHALDYQTYAYLQTAQDQAAQGAMARAGQVVASGEGATAGAAGAGAFALAAMPARYAMERQQWGEAAALTVRPSPNAPYTEAITHFARAVGAARAGKPADAASDIARLAAIRDRLVEMKDVYWTEQVDIQRRVAEAWVLFAEGRKDEGVAALSAAADAEDATDKSAVTPGPIAPARELLGFMLLEAGRAKEALAAFEATIKKEPNRFLALYGAGRAAEALKQAAVARGYFQQVTAICKDAPGDRPALAYARKAAN